MSGRSQQSSWRRAFAPVVLALALLTAACGGGTGSSGTTGEDVSPASAGERAAAAEKQLAKNTLLPLQGKAPAPQLPVTVDSSDGRKVT
ncbi:ABC transporter substrate-binding protein, partial [Streptomyces rochei]